MAGWSWRPAIQTRPVRLTDARDLAAWLIDNSRRRIPGIVNVPGSDGARFGDLLTTCGEMTRADRRTGLDLRWVPDQVLLDAGVEPWTELPMWAPNTPELAGIWTVSSSRALRTGIRYRPLTDTVHDTWAWLRLEAQARGTELSSLTVGGPSASGAQSVGLDPAQGRAGTGRARLSRRSYPPQLSVALIEPPATGPGPPSHAASR